MRDPIRRLRTDIPLGWVLFDALLEVCWLADGHAGKPRPLVAKLQHFAHLSKELRMRIVVPPAPAITKLDEILLPTLDQSEPSASDTVVRTLLPFRHQGSQTAVESALADNQRALLIRATKMNAASSRLFVDFLFVDNRVQIDSTAASFCLPRHSAAQKYVPDHGLTATMPSISTEI